MSDSVAPQLICDDPSGFIIAHLEQAPEEANGCLSISATLQVYVNNVPVLIDCAPKIVLFTPDLNEDLIDEESIPIALVPPSKSLGVPGPPI